MILTAADLARFWAKVDIHGEDDACWLWSASCFERGYGKFWLAGGNRRAPRVSWTIAYGPIPAGRWVLHSCDNPPCVRPSHLFLGTASDNARDAFAKGRRTIPAERARGTQHHRARFSEGDVRAIRRRAAQGEAQHVIAADFGTTQPRISEIVRRQTWRHVNAA